MNDLYETARKWIVQNYSVIPLRYRDKRPHSGLLPRNEWGDPSWEVFKTALPAEDMLRNWFPTRMRNIGLVMGWNDLVVIDFDQLEVFDFWYSQNPLDTYMVKTRRGMHVYLQVEETPANYHSLLLDIKASGYVLIPPSVHPTGFVYYVYKDLPILRVRNLGEVLPPEFLREQVRSSPDPGRVVANLPASDDPWGCAEIADQGAVARIRIQVDLLSFFPGARCKSHNSRWWHTICPFHDDHTPSFWIDTDKQICGCYVGCTPKPLDVIDLYARLHQVSTRDAIRALVNL